MMMSNASTSAILLPIALAHSRATTNTSADW
jgi:hypothetical protein